MPERIIKVDLRPRRTRLSRLSRSRASESRSLLFTFLAALVACAVATLFVYGGR